jgi:hypothetical protein
MIPRFMSQPYLVIFPLTQMIIKILLKAQHKNPHVHIWPCQFSDVADQGLMYR